MPLFPCFYQLRCSFKIMTLPQCVNPRFLCQLLRRLPFLVWLPYVNRDTVRSDAMAGITGAVMALPQGVAFAMIAGMPPEYGLYAGMVPAIIAALFGSSWHLVSGPTTAASIVLLTSLSPLAEPFSDQYVVLALTVTFIVGMTQLILGFARMGVLVNFISHSVIVGFTAGAAILIGAQQLKNFFGVEIERGNLLEILGQFVDQLGNINPYVTVVAVTTLVSGILLKRWRPRWPGMIIALFIGSVLAAVLNAIFGTETTQMGMVKPLPQTLPPLSSPDFSLETLQQVAPAALALTLFALTEAVSIGRSLAARSGQRLDGNQEFIGQGMSNLAGSFFSGYVATGSFNRSGLNYQAGAKTPLAAIFGGVLLMVLVLVVAPYAVYLPYGAMAGLLFMVAWGLFDFKEISHILHASRRETAIMGVTFFGALFLDLELAILAGVLLSLLLYLERTAKPKLVTMAPNPLLPKHALCSEPGLTQCPQLRIQRLDGSLFFGSVDHLHTRISREDNDYPAQKHLALITEGVNFADLAGCDALAKEAKKRHKEGGGFYLINVKAGLWDELDRSGALDEIDSRNVFQSKNAAITGIFRKLDHDICAECDARIFHECRLVERKDEGTPV